MSNLIPYYLDGREDVEDENIEVKIDLSTVAASIMKGGAFRETVHAAAVAALAPLANSEKTEWIDANHDVIEEDGGDADACWAQFMAGRADALAHQIEPDICSELSALIDEAEIESPDDDVESDDE
jgi:hypothetical protein